MTPQIAARANPGIGADETSCWLARVALVGLFGTPCGRRDTQRLFGVYCPFESLGLFCHILWQSPKWTQTEAMSASYDWVSFELGSQPSSPSTDAQASTSPALFNGIGNSDPRKAIYSSPLVARKWNCDPSPPPPPGLRPPGRPSSPAIEKPNFAVPRGAFFKCAMGGRKKCWGVSSNFQLLKNPENFRPLVLKGIDHWHFFQGAQENGSQVSFFLQAATSEQKSDGWSPGSKAAGTCKSEHSMFDAKRRSSSQLLVWLQKADCFLQPKTANEHDQTTKRQQSLQKPGVPIPNHQPLIWGCPTGFRGDSSLLEGNTPILTHFLS